MMLFERISKSIRGMRLKAEYLIHVPAAETSKLMNVSFHEISGIANENDLREPRHPLLNETFSVARYFTCIRKCAFDCALLNVNDNEECVVSRRWASGKIKYGKLQVMEKNLNS